MPADEAGISHIPHAYRGDVWENQTRRNCNRQNLYVFEVYGVLQVMSSEIREQ